MSIPKYLARWAEAVDPAELAALAGEGPWDHAVVIPARREGVECLRAAAAPAERGSLLCVLVVNAGDDPAERRAGEELLEAIAAHPPRWRGEGLSLHRLGKLELLAVDRCRGERAFGPRDGVGLARKLGADLALHLHELGALRRPWIHCTDADARLPADHCERVAALDPGELAATVAPFWHRATREPEVSAATARYELSLRYYLAGLRHAGSRYAFHTIGSLISVSCRAYAAARGFPRRAAGEDFYLLNKLAKLGAVRSLAGAPVEIRSRRSTRVPFGTGPAVEALLAGEQLRVYDPRVFELLARVLAALERAASEDDLDALAGLAREHPDSAQLQACHEAVAGLLRRYPAGQLRARIAEYFDAFRTLKLIHELTATRWPKLAWAAAVSRANFLELDPRTSIDEQRRQLAALELASPGDKGNMRA
jgi:hypothetical protein